MTRRLTIREAARESGYSASTLYKWLRLGYLVPSHGKRVNETDIERAERLAAGQDEQKQNAKRMNAVIASI